jgi:hypothetical protein
VSSDITILTPLGPDPKHADLLRSRAVPSVLTQTAPAASWVWEIWVDHNHTWQHPMPVGDPRITLHHAPPCPDWTHPEAWKLQYALGGVTTVFTAYLGADDEWAPRHLEAHLTELRAGNRMAFSWVGFRISNTHQLTLMPTAPAHGAVDMNGMTHHTGLRAVRTWCDSSNGCPDWDLVAGWLKAGETRWSVIPEVTAIHHDGWLSKRRLARPHR